VSGITAYVPVHPDNWVGLMGTIRHGIVHGKSVTVTFKCPCKDCPVIHEGVVLATHPEICAIQVEVTK
jgi:hypothetical protein